MKYKCEPFKIKMVESLNLTTKAERINFIEQAKYNLFGLAAKNVYIDLLTDSGTNAMSDKQWSAMMLGDEAYSGSSSYFKLTEVGAEVFGYDFIQPVHQGRAAEKVLFPHLLRDRKVSISNMHFDTTRAHIEILGAKAIDCLCEEGFNVSQYADFKGNFDIPRLEKLFAENKNNVGVLIITITNNSAGGQPVSMQNIREASAIAKKHGATVVIDAARFAENAYFIKTREKEYKDKSILDIVREMFSYSDALTMSSKKDAIVNIGGLLGVRQSQNQDMIAAIKANTVPNEGFITYGGLAGRDLEAMAVGLLEACDYSYLCYRIGQIEYLGERLKQAGIPFQYPVGGHAIFLDAKAILPNIPYYQFPAHALAVELYIEAGIRSCDVGSLLLDNDENGKQRQASFEFTRLCLPRRVYTQSHLDVVADAIIEVAKKAATIKGFRIAKEPKVLRHFTAELERVK